MIYQSLPHSLADILLIPLLASLIRISRLSCSRCQLWTDGVSRVQRKRRKISKVSNKNKPQALSQLHNCWESLDLETEIAVWVCTQNGELWGIILPSLLGRLINFITRGIPTCYEADQPSYKATLAKPSLAKRATPEIHSGKKNILTSLA